MNSPNGEWIFLMTNVRLNVFEPVCWITRKTWRATLKSQACSKLLLIPPRNILRFPGSTHWLSWHIDLLLPHWFELHPILTISIGYSLSTVASNSQKNSPAHSDTLSAYPAKKVHRSRYTLRFPLGIGFFVWQAEEEKQVELCGEREDGEADGNNFPKDWGNSRKGLL